MLAYYGSVISENITETPEGFLICKNVPIARTGTQEYLPCEIGLPGEGLINVSRLESEVFAQAAMASFEGKCVTHDHPPNPVDKENVTAYGKGHAQNIRRGTGAESDLLLADLFITDPELIRLVKSRELREVSCGYECEYIEDEAGRFYQSRIRGNHIAVVAAGRAGSRVAIRDSIPTKNERGKNTMNKNTSLFARIFSGWAKDADPAEVAGVVDELMEGSSQDGEPTEPAAKPADNAPAEPAAKPADSDPANQLLIQLLTKIDQKLDAMSAKPAAGDEDPLTTLEQEITGAAAPAAGTGDGNEEAAVTVPADELPENAVDEAAPVAAESEKPENPIPGADSTALLAAISAIKPIIAKLPANERKAASDAAAQKIRASMGMDARARSNGYSAINRVKKSASADSVSKATMVDDAELGRKIMSRHNPHYKKEEK